MGRGKKKGKRVQTKYTDRGNELELSNERFEKYYRTQKILSQDEWDAFIDALRQPLPSTFRIAAHRQMKDVLTRAIKNKFVPQLATARLDGEPLPVPQPIHWYPEGLAWHVGLARKELKKSPEYKKFHEFLVFETEFGNISRQEAVSMLPPLFLDVRPHHSVIDLCAAPGSKTSQLLEAMDQPTGLLIANDSDHKRAHLLVHQSSRLPSPGLMVTNLDASIFPSLKYNDRTLRFDRILADVPCSGDGTLRKNVGIWAKWNPMEANGLHSLQLRILQRAMRMLRPDTTVDDDRPRIVYSTCSLNPVENEAVVAAALNSIPGFELVDVSELLPTLDRRPGIASWRPAVDRDMNLSYSSYKEYCDNLGASGVQSTPASGEVRTERKNSAETFREDDKKQGSKSRQGRNKMLRTHWPPENVQELHLERCIRIYPHLQDTGGFFVAVLQRHASSPRIDLQLRSDGKRAAEVQESNEAPRSTSDGGPVAKKVKLSAEDSEFFIGLSKVDVNEEAEEAGPTSDSVGPFKEDPYTFVSPDDPILVTCIEKWRLSETFPRSNLFVRNSVGTPIRSLYLVNDAVRSVMLQTDYRKIRLISAGVKIFGRSELGSSKRQREDTVESSSTVQFRVLHEGLLALLPYIDTDSVLVGAAKELWVLLETYYPLCSSFEEPFRKSVESRSAGSHVICFKPGDYGQASLSHDLFLPLWKSEVSISLMVDKRVKSALSLRLFGEDITIAGRQAAQLRDEKKAVPEDSSVAKKDSDNDETEGVQ